MTKFVPTTTSHLHGGTRYVYKFGNGYGASVISHQWWNEEGIELVTDIDGPIVAPIPTRAVPHGDCWRLEAVPVDIQTGAEHYLDGRLKDPEYRSAFTEALLATGYPQETES